MPTLSVLSLPTVVQDFDSESFEEIKKEINIITECHNEHIVACKGVFQPAGQVDRPRSAASHAFAQRVVWIVMEFCAVGSLSDLMGLCKRTLTEPQIATVELRRRRNNNASRFHRLCAWRWLVSATCTSKVIMAAAQPSPHSPQASSTGTSKRPTFC
jgi:hypothetical protein